MIWNDVISSHSVEHYTNQLALETKKEITQMIKLPQPASLQEQVWQASAPICFTKTWDFRFMDR